MCSIEPSEFASAISCTQAAEDDQPSVTYLISTSKRHFLLLENVGTKHEKQHHAWQ
jgi:hypothetical protein